MPMDKFKNELLRFGIYGTNLSKYSQEEIDFLYNKDFVEIFYTQDIQKLEQDLNGDSIIKLTDYKMILENLNLLNIRIRFNIFKENLLQYKFKEEYPYKVIDYLLKTEGFVKSSDIRESLNLDSKRIFYVAQRLKRSDVLEQKKEGNVNWFFKIDKDLLFKTDNSIFIVYEAPVIPTNLYMEIPILDQMRNLINNSPVGITTEDVQKQFGLSIRQALHYLNRITEMERNKYHCKEIFIGKIRRLLFYLASDTIVEEKEEIIDKKFVTVEDRIRVLDKMLEEKKGFVISEESLKQFQINLNSNFLPCKKTVMSTALKSGHKIFTLKEKNESKTLVIHKDVSISSYLNNTDDNSNIVFKNQTERLFYTKFVLGPSFTIRDNLFITNEKERLDVFCDYLSSKANDGFIMIDKNFISKMKLKLLFLVIPVDIPNIIFEILDDSVVDKASIYLSIINKLDEISHYELFSRNLPLKYTKRLKISLSYRRIIKSILDLEEYGLIQKFFKRRESNIEKVSSCSITDDIDNNTTSIDRNNESSIIFNNINIMDYEGNTDLNIIKKNEDKDLVNEILNNPFFIKIVPEYKSIIEKYKPKPKKNVYMDYVDRIKCYSFFRSNKKSTAYKFIKKFIKQNYNEIYKELMKTIDEIFGSLKGVENEICIENPNTQEFLYSKIKFDLVLNDFLDPNNYIEYSCVDSVLLKLKEDGVITSNERKLSLESCKLKSKLKAKLVKNFKGSDTKLEEFINRNTIYKMYFFSFYELLVKTGSMELNELLDKTNVCKDFEFTNFIKAYSDVFEMNDVDELQIVSVKIDIDPFDFL